MPVNGLRKIYSMRNVEKIASIPFLHTVFWEYFLEKQELLCQFLLHHTDTKFNRMLWLNVSCLIIGYENIDAVFILRSKVIIPKINITFDLKIKRIN